MSTIICRLDACGTEKMSTIKDRAVCIGSRNYSESSQIVTLFARENGKIRAIAKGGRRERGKFGGGIDCLAGGEILFTPAKNESTLATLIEFDQQRSFTLLREKLFELYCGQYMGELTGQFTEELDPHEQLYDALEGSLAMLGQNNRPDIVLLKFGLILLREIGVMPLWNECGGCGQILRNDQALYFSSGEGGMLCRDCEPAVIEKRLVNPTAWQLLREPEKIESAPRKTVLDAHELLSYHQRELAGKESAISVFVNQLWRKWVDQ